MMFVKERTHDGYVEYCKTPAIIAWLHSCFKDGSQKVSIPYAFRFAMGDMVYTGRGREGFKKFMDGLKEKFDLNENKRIIVYDFHLPYNFHSVYQNVCKISGVFAKTKYNPIKVSTAEGLEFRDFDMLVGKRLLTDKMYTDEVVTTKSALTYEEDELLEKYIETGKKYLEDQVLFYGKAGKLPLTNTSRARKIFRRLTMDYNYRALIRQLTVDPKEMTMLKDAFEGGLCYTNEFLEGEVLGDVESYDLTSSYLSSVCLYKYPMSKGKVCYPESEEELKGKLWVAKVLLKNIRCRGVAWISEKRCLGVKNARYINGKIRRADSLFMAVCNVDFESLRDHYDFDVTFGTVYVYKPGFIPKPYIEKLLEFYKAKSELKGDDSAVVEYTIKKSILNAACFGLMVQDPLRNACRYEDGKWIEDDLTLDEKVDLYNEDKGRFTFYPWGVFVSAYSRRHLLSAISALGDDFAYSDTDSAKFLNGHLHKKWFDRYNQAVANFIWRNLEEMKIDPNLSAPNGKQLGAWEYEGTYGIFKTIGQKRYLGLMNGELKATVSGVNSDGITTFLQKCSLNPFEDFDEDLEVPAEYAKRTFSYLIKTRRQGIIKDRDGFSFEYDEPSGTYLEAGRYHMTLTEIETCKMVTTAKL